MNSMSRSSCAWIWSECQWKISVLWPEQLSPFVTVARLRLPQQDIGGIDNLERMDATSMTPWRVTQEHRPLGNIMRAREGSLPPGVHSPAPVESPDSERAGEPR
jgi:hypothetical protein